MSNDPDLLAISIKFYIVIEVPLSIHLPSICPVRIEGKNDQEDLIIHCPQTAFVIDRIQAIAHSDIGNTPLFSAKATRCPGGGFNIFKPRLPARLAAILAAVSAPNIKHRNPSSGTQSVEHRSRHVSSSSKFNELQQFHGLITTANNPIQQLFGTEKPCFRLGKA